MEWTELTFPELGRLADDQNYSLQDDFTDSLNVFGVAMVNGFCFSFLSFFIFDVVLQIAYLFRDRL